MAENKNEISSSFSIESTMDLGMGNQELIKDLMAPETVSGDAEDLHDIKEEEPAKVEKKPTEKKTPPVKKEEVTEEIEEEEKKEKDGSSILKDFLEDVKDDDDKEEESDVPEKKENMADKEEDAPTEEASKFSALTKDLYKLGVFTKDEDDEEEVEVSTPEEFLEKFQSEGKKKATEAIQDFIGKFGEDYQNAFDAIFVKGADPKEYFAAYNTVVDYAQMDMTNEENQKMVIRQGLTDQGWDAEDVTSELGKLKNYGDLETAAAKHHKVLVKKEALKIQQIEQKAEADLKQKTFIKNQYITNVQSVLQEKLKTKEFDGIPLNSKLASELQDFLLVDKWKTPSGETLTDFDRAILELKKPENHASKVKLGLLLKIMEKDPTLSVIQKSGITKKSNEIFGETAKQIKKVSKGGGNSESQKSNYTWKL